MSNQQPISTFLVASLAAALFVSTTAEADLTGIKFVARPNPLQPSLLICNLYVTFDAPGDNLIAVVGLPAPEAQLVYSTNSAPGFHQETVPIGPQDLPINAVFRGLFPNYIDDTYITIGLKHGYAPGALSMSSIGVLAADGVPGATDWNLGGPLTTASGTGGAYFVVAGAPEAVEVGGQVLIAQLVIDGNASTTDGLAPRIDVVIPQIAWADAAGVASTTNNFSASHGGPPPPPDEACCFEDGSCQDLPAAECNAAGGTPQGPGTVCLGDNNADGVDDACPPPGDDCSAFPCGNNNNKVLLCHVPPGNPDNPQTLCISPNAVPAHLANHPGDHCGPCQDDDGLAFGLSSVGSRAAAVCPADINGDGSINVLDLIEVLIDFGTPGGPSDINDDGVTNVLDLIDVLLAFGTTCP